MSTETSFAPASHWGPLEIFPPVPDICLQFVFFSFLVFSSFTFITQVTFLFPFVPLPQETSKKAVTTNILLNVIIFFILILLFILIVLVIGFFYNYLSFYYSFTGCFQEVHFGDDGVVGVQKQFVCADFISVCAANTISICEPVPLPYFFLFVGISFFSELHIFFWKSMWQ